MVWVRTEDGGDDQRNESRNLNELVDKIDKNKSTDSWEPSG